MHVLLDEWPRPLASERREFADGFAIVAVMLDVFLHIVESDEFFASGERARHAQLVLHRLRKTVARRILVRQTLATHGAERARQKHFRVADTCASPVGARKLSRRRLMAGIVLFVVSYRVFS